MTFLSEQREAPRQWCVCGGHNQEDQGLSLLGDANLNKCPHLSVDNTVLSSQLEAGDWSLHCGSEIGTQQMFRCLC